MTDDLMTLGETAAFLRVPEKTLYMWRHKGTGPRSAKVGRYLRYRRSVVEQWLVDQERAGSAA